jgi:hypothetical protein
LSLSQGTPTWGIDRTVSDVPDHNPAPFATHITQSGITTTFHTRKADTKKQTDSYVAHIAIGTLKQTVILDDFPSLLHLISQLGPGTFAEREP